MSEQVATGNHWTDGWVWHLLAWVLSPMCGVISLGILVVGIIRASQGRGHGLWISSLCAVAFGVCVGLAIRLA
jgi:hypothetical protein